MPLNKVKAGSNMYQGWITHCHSHLGGACPFHCSYCYVASGRTKNHPRYNGPIRLIERELAIIYGSDKTIFIEHCSDLFAEAIPLEFIERIMAHCKTWPDNTYVFQTKNPFRLFHLARGNLLPPNAILGVTIETNRTIAKTLAPDVYSRYKAALNFRRINCQFFVTIEPIMVFDLEEFAGRIRDIDPIFVNIGADSKGHNLPEPSWEEVRALIDKIREAGIEVRLKKNLNRLNKKEGICQEKISEVSGM